MQTPAGYPAVVERGKVMGRGVEVGCDGGDEWKCGCDGWKCGYGM